MKLPAFLLRGDAIGLAASARKINASELQPALDLISQAGFLSFVPDGFFATHGPYAGDDLHRANILQYLWNRSDLHAVLFARGGYGSVRMVDLLDWNAFANQPKWLCGFSDVTVLHAHAQTLGIPTIHSCMPITMRGDLWDDASVQSLFNCLQGCPIEYTFPSHPFNISGSCSAEVVGGNLSVLYSLMGSKSEPDYRNKILFIEDVGEYVYHIDRMLMAFRRSGKWDHLKGLVVGSMSDMNDNADPFAFGKTAYEIIHEHMCSYDIPICFGFPAGHEKKNLAFYLGSTAELQIHATETVFKQSWNR